MAWNLGIYSELLSELFPQGLVKDITAKSLCKVVKTQLKNVSRPQMSNEFTQQQTVEQTIDLYEELLKITHPEKVAKPTKPKPKNSEISERKLCRNESQTLPKQ